jgi:hypothetical protein
LQGRKTFSMPLKAREYEKNQQLRGANLLYIGDREK